MKKIILIICFLMTLSFCFADDIELTEEEKSWLENQDKLYLGLDPYTGMDYFIFKDKARGYVVDLVEILEHTLKVEVEIVGDKTWNDVYQGLINKDIDILFGANVTEERLKFMSFTQPVHQYPYGVFINKNSLIKTFGDLDGGKVGFLEGDIAIDLFEQAFQNITYEIIEYADQPAGMDALTQEKIDGFITSGGGIEFDFIYNYPSVGFMTEITDITSDMTLATHKDNEILAGILNKVINDNMSVIDKKVAQAQIIYNRKLLQLSDQELSWFDSDGVATVGVVHDYLPFDYYKDGDYQGIAGAIINEISNIIGIKFEYVYGEFDEIYELAKIGQVDIINIAKTTDRLENFIFPRSFKEERDLIYGDKSSEPVHDIYGLEGKRIAVIKGFWHKEMLEKSLRDVTIVQTNNIKESLQLVNRGLADYFIENPTVTEYYITGLGYFNIIKKGETSSDSFLYFGVNKRQKELASIIDKALVLIDYDEQKQIGLSQVPKLIPLNVKYLVMVISILVVIIALGTWMLIRSIQSLIKEREATATLREREHLMYMDPLTGLNNRLYYNSVENDLEYDMFPQAIIVCDLNKLKHINDSMGHHMGDAYIKTFGELLASHFSTSIVCRMGGDEFLVIMKSTPESQVKKTLEDLYNLLPLTRVEYEATSFTGIDVAIGYAMRYNRDHSLEEKLIEADNNMYANKKTTSR